MMIPIPLDCFDFIATGRAGGRAGRQAEIERKGERESVCVCICIETHVQHV